MTFERWLQVGTVLLSLSSLLVAVGAYRRSGSRVRVRAGRSGWIGPDEDPAFARAISVTVWNQGDAQVTVEHWGFEYSNRLRLPALMPGGGVRGIGMYSVE